MKSNQLAFLKTTKIFSHLTGEEIETLMQYAEYTTVKAHETLFLENASSNELCLVLSGVFDSSVKSDAGEIVVATFHKGDLFGEMSFFDKRPRSAACRAKKQGIVVGFSRKVFSAFQKKNPQASSRILLNILQIITNRIHNSNSFLSEMVFWGDNARKRSLTDELTGLFNRRYIDEMLDNALFDARINNSHVVLIMIDIDNFGKINRDYGQSEADSCIHLLADVLKEICREHDVAARYGGDEFIVLLPNSHVHDGQALCENLKRQLSNSVADDSKDTGNIRFTLSQGIAEYPAHASSKHALIAAADTALYQSKKLGRDRWHIYDATLSERDGRKSNQPTFQAMSHDVPKKSIFSITEKNKIINNIISGLLYRSHFIIIGHHHADEDCIASAVSFALLLKKIRKDVTICLQFTPGKRINILRNICKYNNITVISPNTDDLPDCDTLIVCDTPKPDMIAVGPNLKALVLDDKILTIEVDHHLGADSRHTGHVGYSLTTAATSTCELILAIFFKLQKQRTVLMQYKISDIFSRNIVLSLLIGVLGDTQNGKFLRSARDKRMFYQATHYLESLMKRYTFGVEKATELYDVARMADEQSQEEEQIEKYFMSRVHKHPYIDVVNLNKIESLYLANTYEQDIIQHISRNVTDQIAENSGYLGLVGYVDMEKKPQAQFRLRCSQTFTKIDLRNVLKKCNIKDGGGHAGAVGFRIPFSTDKDIKNMLNTILQAISELIEAP